MLKMTTVSLTYLTSYPMTNTQQDDYILKSELRKMIEEKISHRLWKEWKEENVKNSTLYDILSELDKLPSRWIAVTDKYSYREYCEYPHSNSEYEIYFWKREVYDIDDWRNMMVIKAHSYHHDDLPPHP